MRKMWPVWLVLWLTLIMTPARVQPAVLTLTILHSNDFHGSDMGLLAKRATIIQKIRAEAGLHHPVLLLEAGDVFTRGPYANRFKGALEFAVMNHLQYDAMTLGNNEFKATANSSAKQFLLERIKQADFPILCANVVQNADNAGAPADYLPGVKPYIIKELNGIRIGIFGVTAKRVKSYSQIKGWKVLDPIKTSEQIIQELTGRADILIALTHIGIEEDRTLARSVTGLGAIIGGDSHTILRKPEWINGQPIVQAGDYGYFLGKLELTFEKDGETWRLRESAGELIRLGNDEIIPDPATQKIIQEFLQEPQRPAA